MTGKLIIDTNIDAYNSFGVFITEGGYNQLVSFPQLKEIRYNDWPEENGIDADLSSPFLDVKEFSISFANKGSSTSIYSFIATICNGAYHDFNFAEIGLQRRLRYKNQENYEYHEKLGLFNLTFVDDFPLANYTYVAPSNGIASPSNYLIDGKTFASYGISVLEGSMAEVLKSREAKQNLTINQRNFAGATYDGNQVFFKSKDVQIYLLIRANNLGNLWKNYNAFLYDLIRAGKRILSVNGTEYNCRYKSADVQTFLPYHNWLKFSITLEFL